jgi:hypothetical protein
VKTKQMSLEPAIGLLRESDELLQRAAQCWVESQSDESLTALRQAALEFARAERVARTAKRHATLGLDALLGGNNEG